MSIFKKLEEIGEAAKQKTRELDDQFRLREKFEQGINTAGKVAEGAVRKGAETINDVTKTATEQAKKIDEEYRVSEKVRETAERAGETFKSGVQSAQSGAENFGKTAEEKAREVLGTAEKFYQRAGQAYDAGTAGAKLLDATISGYAKTREWIRENPGRTAVVSLSLIAGIRAGSAALPNLAVTVLGAGAAHNWLLHSSLPIIGVRKVTERYHEYLKQQEHRLNNGELDEAERASIEFQRNMTKYVGAPLLGAFSVAAGATMIGSAFTGATATGFPVSLILGGNPLLNGIWFFANGVVCISEGYKFFMIALADEEEVQKVVREIKGLLPA